jgi:hypothetical protein
VQNLNKAQFLDCISRKVMSLINPSNNKMEEIEEYQRAVTILTQLEELCADDNSLEKVRVFWSNCLISRENKGTS